MTVVCVCLHACVFVEKLSVAKKNHFQTSHILLIPDFESLRVEFVCSKGTEVILKSVIGLHAVSKTGKKTNKKKRWMTFLRQLFSIQQTLRLIPFSHQLLSGSGVLTTVQHDIQTPVHFKCDLKATVPRRQLPCALTSLT